MASYIFDFDGTLADSFPVASNILVENAKKLGCKQLDTSEVNKLKDLHAKEVIKYLEIPFWKMPWFFGKFRNLLKEKTDEIAIFPDWINTLKTLKKNGHMLGILSSNSEKTIKSILKKHQLLDLFDLVISEKSLFGKSRPLKKLIKRLNLDKNNTYYIGDETRDIEAAKKCNIHSVAVSWGFNSVTRLKAAKPDLLINKPLELIAKR